MVCAINMLRLAEAAGARTKVAPSITPSQAAGVLAALAAVMALRSEKAAAACEGGSVRDKIAAFADKAAALSSTAPTPTPARAAVMQRAAGRGGGGSVRDKIAKFGDSKTVNAGSGTNGTSSSISNVDPAKFGSSAYDRAGISKSESFSTGERTSAASTGPVNKLNVPDIFKGASNPPGRIHKSSAPSKKWGVPGTSANGRGSCGSGPSARAGSGSSGSQRAFTRGALFTASSGSLTAEKGPRDILGLGLATKAASSRTVGNRSAAGGGGSGSSVYVPYILKESVGRAKANSDTVRKGPRRLQLKTISAEKQRAALGLDKDKEG